MSASGSSRNEITRSGDRAALYRPTTRWLKVPSIHPRYGFGRALTMSAAGRLIGRRRRIARENRPAPFLRLGEVDDLLQHRLLRFRRREFRRRKVHEVRAAVGHDDHVGAVVRFLDSRRHQHLRQHDSELDRREAVVRDDDQIGLVRDSQRVDRRAHAHQVVVAKAERFHRGQRAQPGDVLREIGIMLPEDDQRGPASVGSDLGGRQRVLDHQPREVQIALLVGHRSFRIGWNRDFLTRRLRDQVFRREQVILVRLADDILAVDDRCDAIVEHRGRSLLADHADVAALARDFLRDSVEPDQAPFELIRLRSDSESPWRPQR